MKKRNSKLKINRVPSNPKDEELPKITILAERTVEMVELDLDIDDKAHAVLAQAGWETIQKDKQALASYAFVEALKEFVEREEKNNA